MKIFYYFLQSLPECIGTIALSLALARVSLKWERIFIGGFLLAVLTYGIRSLPITFGFHLPVAIFVIFLAITRMTDVKPSHAIIAVFSSFFTVALLEYIISTAFFAFTRMDLNKALADEGLWTALGIAQDIILIIIAIIIPHFIKPIEGAWKK